MARAGIVEKRYDADATEEYRGAVEVVSEAIAPRPVESIAPVAMDAGAPDIPQRSPDQSLEFPHPVSAQLFADATGDVSPLDLDDLGETRVLARHRAPRRLVLAFASVMIVGAALCGFALAAPSRPSSELSQTTTLTKLVDPAYLTVGDVKAPEPVVTPPPVAASAEKPAPSTMGVMHSPKWAKGRPVYLDGSWIGVSGDLEVACGAHRVQVGVAGKTKKIAVPCGGTVVIVP